MTPPLAQKLALGAAGATAIAIGLAITLAPAAFYASNGVALGADPSLLSELRAPGASLAAIGALIFAGAVRPSLTRRAALLGAVVFLAYAAGRIVSMLLDGLPSEPLLWATAVELAIGGLCLSALRGSAPPAPRAASKDGRVVYDHGGSYV